MNVAAVLLAAGQSRRMGGENKLLLDAGGETVLARTVKTIKNARFSEIVAVSGFDRDAVEAELRGQQVSVHFNSEFAQGVHSSIRKGLVSLTRPFDFAAICLSDQPTMRSEDYDFLIAIAQWKTAHRLIAPVYRGEPGNPVLIAQSLLPEILREADSDRGCRYLFERYPQDVLKIEMRSAATVFDVDTREAYNHFKEIIE